jgi:hypothetical protein
MSSALTQTVLTQEEITRRIVVLTNAADILNRELGLVADATSFSVSDNRPMSLNIFFPQKNVTTNFDQESGRSVAFADRPELRILRAEPEANSPVFAVEVDILRTILLHAPKKKHVQIGDAKYSFEGMSIDYFDGISDAFEREIASIRERFIEALSSEIKFYAADLHQLESWKVTQRRDGDDVNLQISLLEQKSARCFCDNGLIQQNVQRFADTILDPTLRENYLKAQAPFLSILESTTQANLKDIEGQLNSLRERQGMLSDSLENTQDEYNRYKATSDHLSLVLTRAITARDNESFRQQQAKKQEEEKKEKHAELQQQPFLASAAVSPFWFPQSAQAPSGLGLLSSQSNPPLDNGVRHD